MTRNLSQRQRILTAIIYIIVVYITSKSLYTYESFLPPVTNTWIWFWVASITLLIATLIDQPFYVAPQHAFLNSIGGLLAIYEIFIDISDGTISSSIVGLWRLVSFIFLFVIVISLLAIFLKDVNQRHLKAIGRISTFSSRSFGSAYVVNTIIFLLAVWSFNSTQSQNIFWLLTLWGVIIFVQPIERILKSSRRFIPAIVDAFKVETKLGEVIARREPNIVTIKITSSHLPKSESLLLISTTRGHYQLAVTIDNYELAHERWCRALVLKNLDNIPKKKISSVNHQKGSAIVCQLEYLDEGLKTQLTNHEWFKTLKDFVGLVIEGSTVNSVIVELVKPDPQLTEGKLLTINISNQPVLYQIIDGITDSEVLEKANRHGFIEIKARKLGRWTQDSKLEQIPWIPEIYSPVQFTQPDASKFSTKFLGYIPRTNYGITVDCHSLVTHNTSILGVLGSGKTRLSLELVGRMLEAGIHVYIVDITGRYKPDLESIIDIKEHNKLDKDLRNGIKGKENDIHENRSQGGNQSIFRDLVGKEITKLINNKVPQLRIFEPNEVLVTEQTTNRRSVNENGNWSQQAEISVMTPAKITRIITESVLERVQKKGVSDKGRICLVFEEAHSLIPEWNVAVSDGDSRASNATARAILQGRKYGLGCLLITQRTAHVTKSILNQCHTVFALQTFDKTGMDFLSNYIGDDYTNTLTSLTQRHCVAYGKALNTGSPLIVELNEHKNSNDIASKFYTETQNAGQDIESNPQPDSNHDLL